MVLKKIWIKIYSFFLYLSKGLNHADKIAFGSKNDALDSGIRNEQHEEEESVWSDLLKGELTQRVIDLRYETAHADRESKKYEHVGGGIGKKKNNMFSYSGNIENSDNLPLFLVQENKEEVSTLTDAQDKVVRTFRLKVLYDYICRFRLDVYAKKCVIKKTDNEKRFIIDFYVTKYHEKSNNEHKFFLSEIKRILEGDRRSDILGISNLSFETFNAFGAADGITYEFTDFYYINIVEFDGNYILRFNAKLKKVEDFIDSIYNKESERKFKEKEKREGYIPNVSTVFEVKNKEEEDNKNYERLTELFNDDNGGEN